MCYNAHALANQNCVLYRATLNFIIEMKSIQIKQFPRENNFVNLKSKIG
jgi:hypothetical protein